MNEKAVDYVLSATISEAIRQREQQKARGVPSAEIDPWFESIVRVAWPKGREQPWHYLCDDCRDYGLIMRSEVNRMLIRVDVGYPCHCEKGARFTPKQRNQDDFTDAGKVKKQPSRWGR